MPGAVGRERERKFLIDCYVLFVHFLLWLVSGRLFDKDGNLKDWWSPSSSLNFNSRASCLVYQYNGYEVFGHNVSSYL